MSDNNKRLLVIGLIVISVFGFLIYKLFEAFSNLINPVFEGLK